MSEIVPIAATGIIGALSGIIGSYAIIRHTMSIDNIYDKLDEITEEIVKDTRMQQKLYAIGAILGQGIASGTGLKGMMPSGKFKMQDILGMALQRFMGGGQQQQQTQQDSGEIGLVKR